MKSLRRSSVTALAACSLAASLLSAARADVNGYWIDSSNWLFSMTQMPDIDQKRGMGVNILGLPSNGNMYCVPTSAIDLLGYIATHGYPAIPPGTKNYAVNPPNANYNLMTTHLTNMGVAMNTDPINGTGGTGFVNGIKSFIAVDAAHANDFTVSIAGAQPNAPVSMEQVTKAALTGSIASLVIGWYKHEDATNRNYRSGGHVVALNGASSIGLFTPANVSLRDPNKGTPSSLITQSTYSTETYDVSTASGTWGWYDNNNVFHSSGPLDALSNYGSGHIDGVLLIKPLKGLTADVNYIVILNLAQLRTETLLPAVQKALSGDGTAIASLAMDPLDSVHPYITARGDSLWEIETVTGASRRVMEIAHARQVVIGGTERSRFVRTDTHIVSLSRDGRLKGSLMLPAPAAAMAFDSKLNRLVVTSFSNVGTVRMQDLHFYDAETLDEAGALRFAVGSAGELVPAVRLMCDGSVFQMVPGQKFITRLPSSSTDAPVKITLVGVKSPAGFTIDDQGRFLVSDNGVVKVFNRDGSVATTKSLVKGKMMGALLDVTRSYSNLSPLMDNNPAFHNVLPENSGR